MMLPEVLSKRVSGFFVPVAMMFFAKRDTRAVRSLLSKSAIPDMSRLRARSLRASLCDSAEHQIVSISPARHTRKRSYPGFVLWICDAILSPVWMK
jgi:hypothetical protein